MKKKKEEKKDQSWFEMFFPQTDILFKNLISLFIVYYTITWLIKVIQITSSNSNNIVLPLTILWVISYWIIYNIRQMNLNFNQHKKAFTKWMNKI